MRLRVLSVLLLCAVAQSQDRATRLPCEYSGKLLVTPEGEAVRFTSEQMKRRAIKKVDLSDFIQQADIKGSVIIDVLVGSKGDVHCLQTLSGHPLIRTEIERVLFLWKFRPARVKGKSYAYLGRLEFRLCGINCGAEGRSMTLLK